MQICWRKANTNTQNLIKKVSALGQQQWRLQQQQQQKPIAMEKVCCRASGSHSQNCQQNSLVQGDSLHGSLHAHSHTYTETHTHTQVQGMAPFASAHSAMQSNSCAHRAHSFATADVAAIAACNHHNNNKCNNNHSGKSAAKDMQLSAWRFRNV